MSTNKTKDKPKTDLGKLGVEINSAVRDVDVDWVEGIADRRKVLENGMIRFEIKNDEGRLPCTVFSRTAETLPEFQNGTTLRVKLGRLDFYAPFCQISGIVDEIEIR